MIRLGILGCSDIAFKRFMPAAKCVEGLEVVAVAEEYDPRKLAPFCEAYGLEGAESFAEVIGRDDIDAIYVPQPPALHHRWAKQALLAGRHVLVEKPSTTEYALSEDLVNTAAAAKLALHENYMFQYHSQIARIRELIAGGAIGEVRLYSACFGFPMRAQNDFRYNRVLGGGALLDAGGYTAKLATLLLGGDIRVTAAQLNGLDGFEVDMYGSASFVNGAGTVCQVAFGMDCGYRCSLEVWGSKGRLLTNRIFTAPDGYRPTVTIERQDGAETIALEADSHFRRSIEQFVREITDDSAREAMYADILTQARLVEDMRRLGAR